MGLEVAFGLGVKAGNPRVQCCNDIVSQHTAWVRFPLMGVAHGKRRADSERPPCPCSALVGREFAYFRVGTGDGFGQHALVSASGRILGKGSKGVVYGVHGV